MVFKIAFKWTSDICQELQLLNFSWDQKKVVDRESKLIHRKIKESINSLRNSNYFKVAYAYLKYSFLIYGILSFLSISHQ